MTDGAARPAIPAAIADGRVIAVARGLTASVLPGIAAALYDAGILAFEVALDSPDALAGLAAVAGFGVAAGKDRLLVGAGTVLSVVDAEASVAAGAQFLATRTAELDVIAWAAARGIPAFPGAMTPTEILAAWREGAAGVKVFPAGSLGPGYFREVRRQVAGIPLVPTGGVTGENAPAFLASGAVAVGIGDWLTGSGDPELVAERARSLLAALAGSPRSDTRQTGD